ncbi:undecaprenyl-phosphate glucose phosphotransferase [Niastella caeni]|uniref:Undecaprenyl-phosphate glucose phosphotransferase n=1 Tax=Niastella caeni TaxID=2569763 RepID=A0A4S8HYT8_9BACT|nr:undecaprenyl-phosphate glucose phosphotransferase [Niastella caeni]THU40963.1 undecaprenyl-phosphate glucose phosphotransferase [Niastella caeni]
MNNRFLRHLQLTLLAMDLMAINIVFFIARFFFQREMLIEAYVEYTYFGVYLNVAWLVVSLSGNVYHERNIFSFELFAGRSTRAFLYFLLMICGFLFFSHFFIISRLFIATIIVGIPLLLVCNRFLYLAVYHYFKKKDFFHNKVIVLGYNDLSRKLVDYLEEDGVNKEVVGYCEELENIHELSRYPILGNINGALDVCKRYGATEIYSTIVPEQNPGIYRLIKNADQNCIRFRIVPDIGALVKRQVYIDYLNEIPVLSLRREPLDDLGNKIKKRLFDIVVSALVLVFILSWLIPIIGLLIKLESKGPVFFRQQRSGQDNKSFWCWKFRSMTVNDNANVLQATRNDARITKLGQFLRRTSLDEFPQFINVLMGDMSIVGPRPHMLKHTADYSKIIDEYMIRQFLKPGITGWAQVNGFRGETKTLDQMKKRVEYDLWYMENWSMWLDLKIIFLTVFNTIKGEENAF